MTNAHVDHEVIHEIKTLTSAYYALGSELFKAGDLGMPMPREGLNGLQNQPSVVNGCLHLYFLNKFNMINTEYTEVS